MKKIVSKVVFCMVAIIGIMGMTISVSASVKNDIKSEISKKLSSGNIVKKVYCYDYDNNGRKEAFVLTGKASSSAEENGDNDLWFAYQSAGKVYASVIKKDVLNACKVLKLKDVKLFCAAEYCTTSLPMDLYRVNGNRAEFIFRGDSIKKDKGNSFVSIHSTYDFMNDSSTGMKIGHTWKPYWFYYKNGKIYQYKAKKISVKKFKKKYKNAEKILKKYKSKGKIVSILKRTNGLIHINFKSGENNSYVTFKVKKKKLVKPFSDAGIYLKKMPGFTY